MSESTDFAVIEVPARIADLAFRTTVPSDWNVVDLPPEEVDFSSPASFFPLMLAAAPWGAVVLSIAARPGFEDGTLQDWVLFLLSSLEIRPTSFGPASIGGLQGLAGIGSQMQEGTRLSIRFGFFEDGGRLIHLGLLAPEAISPSLEPVWQAAIRGFVLERPMGQSVPLGSGLGFMPEKDSEDATEQQNAQQLSASAAPGVEESEPAEASSGVETEGESDGSDQESLTEEDLGAYAKSGDLDTLDPDHPINARLRDQGVGLVPNLLEADVPRRTARLGAVALGATIRVAFGWHVIDDGRRTMVLDPDGKVQINLNVLPLEGRSVDEILNEIAAETEESYPNPEFLRLQDGEIQALAIRNISVNDEPVEQIHMLTPWMQGSAVLRARVTSDSPSMRFAANYAELILKSAEAAAEEEEEDQALQQQELQPPAAARPAPVPEHGPAWLRRARHLEREDRLEEAEDLIRDAIPSLHSAIATADLYRERWIRLRESGGDPAKIREARQKAADWARNYAASATSGGEGAALSLERDEFLRELGPEPLD